MAASAVEPDTVLYLWPDNVVAWGVWCDVQTQWAHSPGGPSGLQYAGVRAHLDEMGFAGTERRDIYAGVRAAERATLDALALKREQAEHNQR